MKLSDRLKELRYQQHMTLLQVAEKTKLSVSYLSDLERGRTKPSLDTLDRLAACYRLALADVLLDVDGWGYPTIEGLAPGLADLVKEGKIDERSARDLNRIELRGQRPQAKEEWLQLYLYLEAALKHYPPSRKEGGQEE